MKLWVDDLKAPGEFSGLFELPDAGEWTWVKTFEGALAVLREGRVSFLALDNDLGQGSGKDGRDIATWLLGEVLEDRITPPSRMVCISFNPVAKRAILATFDDIIRISEGGVLL